MTRNPLGTLASLLLALACSCGGGNGASDGGDAGFADICNDPTTPGAPQCELNVVAAPVGDGGTTSQQFYIDHVGKQLWLWLTVPAAGTGPSLFNIVAGYTAQSTAVVLSLSLFETNHATPLPNTQPQAAIQSAAGKPGLISYTFVLDPVAAPPGSIVWIELQDASSSHDDVHNPFSIYADVVADPDPNSSTTPTVVTLGGTAGGVQTGTCANVPSGTCQGVLSTEGRIDTFTVAVPASATKPILYTDITAETDTLTPPPAYDLAFTIADSTGNILNSGNVPNVYTSPFPADAGLASALLVNPGETYTIQVFGLNPALNPPIPPAPFDPRVTYSLNVEVLPNLDLNAQTLGDAFANPIQFSSPGAASPLPVPSGQLSYLGQNDWFYLQFPDTAGQPTRLHYKFTPGTSGNRFPAMGPNPPDRQANLMLDIPPLPDGGSSAGVCNNDPSVCPQDPEYVGQMVPDSGMFFFQSQLVQQLCNDGDGDGGSFCLLSGREEFNAYENGFAPLQNFEGIVPLQGTGAQGMVLRYFSSGSRFADDMPYTLALDWETMPNPLSSMQNPLSFGTLGGTPTTQSGTISVGYGFLQQYLQMLQLPDVRGADDYDATPSTADVWEVDIPASFQSAAEGASWSLGWSVTGSVESVLLSVAFCTSPTDCQSFGPGIDGVPGAIYFQGGDDLPWWDPSGAGGFGIPFADYSMYPLFNKTTGTDTYSVTASPFSCTCIQPNFLPAGKFYVTVLGADRTAWTDTPYTLSMGISSYPQSTGADGVSCPVGLPVPDGGTDAGPVVGCQFLNGFGN